MLENISDLISIHRASTVKHCLSDSETMLEVLKGLLTCNTLEGQITTEKITYQLPANMASVSGLFIYISLSALGIIFTTCIIYTNRALLPFYTTA